MPKSINPATEEVIEEFSEDSSDAVEAKIAAADKAFRSWRLSSFETRGEPMQKAADLLEERSGEYALTMTLEMGKPLAQAKAEIEKCAWVCRHYAEHAEAYLLDEVIETDAANSFVRNLPLGPVLAVMPWNFPFWQVFRFAAPTLMAGNVGLLKHASNVWRCAIQIEELFQDAGFPEACFQTLLIGSDKVERVIKDDRVKAVTLTGSGPAGGTVASIAGVMIKPSLLELGGADSFIVMPSADLDAAVDTAVKARKQNNGQSCIAAKRFFVHADIYSAFRDAFVAKFENLMIGDPTSEGTDIGPLATKDIRDELVDQVEQSEKAGAKRLTSARSLPDKGWYAEPVILEDGPEDSPVFKDELFGPAAGLWKAASLESAITQTNMVSFGLGSAIFTNEEAEMDQAIRDIEAGSTFVNAMVGSDPRLPFGGVKRSGYGRELGRDGILAFVNRKTVLVA